MALLAFVAPQATSFSFSATATESRYLESSNAVAAPTMPQPTIRTSYINVFHLSPDRRPARRFRRKKDKAAHLSLSGETATALSQFLKKHSVRFYLVSGFIIAFFASPRKAKPGPFPAEARAEKGGG